jgi:hypothetical protein
MKHIDIIFFCVPIHKGDPIDDKKKMEMGKDNKGMG